MAIRARNAFQGRFHSSDQPSVNCVCLESLSHFLANLVAANVNRGSTLRPKVRFSAKNVPPGHIHSLAQMNVHCVCLESLNHSPANPSVMIALLGNTLMTKVRFNVKSVHVTHNHIEQQKIVQHAFWEKCNERTTESFVSCANGEHTVWSLEVKTMETIFEMQSNRDPLPHVTNVQIRELSATKVSLKL